MRTLSEIRRNIVSFYTSIQDRITDLAVGSVAGGIIYSFSAALERLYEEAAEIKRQAYVATATGGYLDRLIEGTFQLPRVPATRAVGYVVIYGDAPIISYENIELRYAEYDYDTGEFLAGVQDASKFIGFNLQGEEGTVFALINPRNSNVLLPAVDPSATDRLIYIDRPVQFLVLPVASVLTGSKVNIREGGIYSFPSPPPGVSGVLNTSNPGAIFFSSSQAVSGAPFYSRFTELLDYDNSTSSMTVLNAFNFSRTGYLEITGDVTGQHPIVAVYTDGSVTYTGGLIFEYIDASTSGITLANPIENSMNQIPQVSILEGGSVHTLTLESFTYKSTTYDFLNSEDVHAFVMDFLEDGLRIQQRPDQISGELIFDPDGVLTSDYRMIDSALVGGASNVSTDAEYREALRKYLASLGRATGTALEAGTLQIPGVEFARTLPSNMSPRGSAIILAANEDGNLSGGLKGTISQYLENNWKAAGINIIVREPSLIKVNATLTIRTDAGAFHNSITQQTTSTLEEYLRQILPGGSIRYSDILEAVTQIGAVTNVFNLLITKQLTNDTYAEHKAAYDESVLSRASTSGLKAVAQSSHGFTAYSPEDPPVLVELIGADEYGVAATPSSAVGILYNVIDANNIEVFEGNATALANLYLGLISSLEVVTYDSFRSVLINNLSALGATLVEQRYFLSYILSEPIETLPVENYPIDPDNINYGLIRDYTASELEIFRMNTITLGNTILPLVGIRYI